MVSLRLTFSVSVATMGHDACVGVDRITLPDAVLVARVRAGDRDCFGVLLERHLPVVRGVCRGLLGRSAVVDDVMQEAAVEAFVKIDSLRSPERFGPWLCGIALNIARRWLRHAHRERWDGTAVEEVVVIDDSPSPEEAMLASPKLPIKSGQRFGNCLRGSARQPGCFTCAITRLRRPL